MCVIKPIVLSGRVIRGEGMAGKILGCPTANIAVEQGAVIPALGVYVGETDLDGMRYPSLICISDGRTGNHLKMEVHLLDQLMDLGEKFLKVELFHRLRDIVPFPGEHEMAALIQQDLARARDWFLRTVEG